MDLYDNLLHGRLPPEIGSLANLELMDMAVNSLEGPIPPELGQLARLESVHLLGNSLSGPIPPEITRLVSLRSIDLAGNELEGPIPSGIGNLKRLENLWLYSNNISGPLPREIGNLAALEHLSVSDNPRMAGRLPRSLMQLHKLRLLRIEGTGLCAPPDREFRQWVSDLPSFEGSYCSTSFTEGLNNQIFTVDQPIDTLVLPESFLGSSLTYFLSPALPAGLLFDPDSRILSGIPVRAGPTAPYTYTASEPGGNSEQLIFTIEVVPAVDFEHDIDIADLCLRLGQPMNSVSLLRASGGKRPITYFLNPELPAGLVFDSTLFTLSGIPTAATEGPQPFWYHAIGANGSRDSLRFIINVPRSASAQDGTVPESFKMHGNYPNPFTESIRLVFDLPWPAVVRVEVMDLAGRRVITLPPREIDAGWARDIKISGPALPSGVYLYRLKATSPEHSTTDVGRFVRIR
ncbi:MAG: putative Ig domain-containing protein [Bacteroidota bacterium]|nr:putative Ig domain-containing protein [Bacteroidota bacterium]